MYGRPIGVPNDVDVTIFGCDHSTLGDFLQNMVLLVIGRDRSVPKKVILIWYSVAGFVDPGIFVADAAMEHARRFGDSLNSDSAVGVFRSGFVDGFGNFGKARLSDLLVMMAVPHDVIGSGSGSFALRMVTFVGIGDASFIKSVWRSNAPSDDGLEHPSFVRVSFVLVLGVLFIKV